jgi:hypothetical protein
MVIPNNEDNICPKWSKVISRINFHTVCRIAGVFKNLLKRFSFLSLFSSFSFDFYLYFSYNISKQYDFQLWTSGEKLSDSFSCSFFYGKTNLTITTFLEGGFSWLNKIYNKY